MKYSRTERPSRKFDLIGSSMIPPEGLAISPRIPASCLIWLLEPRAPELAIMKMLLYLPSPLRRASVILSLAMFHASITLLCLSSSVIRPRLNFFVIRSTAASASARYSFFFSGITISETETVRAPIVEYL